MVSEQLSGSIVCVVGKVEEGSYSWAEDGQRLP